MYDLTTNTTMIIAVSLGICIIASLLQPALQVNVASSVAGRVGETVTGVVSNEAMLMLSYDITEHASLVSQLKVPRVVRTR